MWDYYIKEVTKRVAIGVVILIVTDVIMKK